MAMPGQRRSGRRAGRTSAVGLMVALTRCGRRGFRVGRVRGAHTMPRMPLVLVSSDAFDRHLTPPGHPERPERAHVFDAVATAWRAGGGEVRAPRPATLDELAAVHDRDHLERIA